MEATIKRHYDRGVQSQGRRAGAPARQKDATGGRWPGHPIRQHPKGKREYEAGRFNEDFVAPVPKAESLEIMRLKKELLDAQLERDILKEAVAIFSKNGR